MGNPPIDRKEDRPFVSWNKAERQCDQREAIGFPEGRRKGAEWRNLLSDPYREKL